MSENQTAAIEAAVIKALADAGVAFGVRYLGETSHAQGKRAKPWECDAWCVDITRKDASMRADYYTGLGLRKQGKPVVPHIAGILSSLAWDAEACDQSFQDWCVDNGYDSDSISALNCYQACGRTGRDLMRVLGRELVNDLRGLFIDY